MTQVELRLYTVLNQFGNPVGFSPDDPFPVGYTLRLDVTGRDRFNRETWGDRNGSPIFFYSDPSMVADTDLNHDFQRKLKVLKPGTFRAWVTFDGVRSNDLVLKLVP